MGFSSFALGFCVLEGALNPLQAPDRTQKTAVRHRDVGAIMGSAATLHFRLLGPLELWREGRPLRLGGERQRALLALLLHANEVVSSERLIEELNGGDAAETGVNALQVAISRLRRLLGEGRSFFRGGAACVRAGARGPVRGGGPRGPGRPPRPASTGGGLDVPRR
jgi:Transcriptional regulatory protein, C terminal